MTGRHYNHRRQGQYYQNGYDTRSGYNNSRYNRSYGGSQNRMPSYAVQQQQKQQWRRDDEESVESSQWTPQASSISQPSSPSASLPSKRGPGSLDLDGSTSEASERSVASTCERRSRSVERCMTPRERNFPRAPSLETGITKKDLSDQQHLSDLVDEYLEVLAENDGVIPMTDSEVSVMLSSAIPSHTTTPVRGEDRHRESWVCTVFQYDPNPPEAVRRPRFVPPPRKPSSEAAKLNPNAQAWCPQAPAPSKKESQSLECWSGFSRKAIMNLVPSAEPANHSRMPPPGWSPPTAYRR